MHSMWKTPSIQLFAYTVCSIFLFPFLFIPIHLSHKLRFLLCLLLPLLIHAKRHKNANAQWKKSIKYSNQYFMFELAWVTCDWFWWDSISRFHVILPCAKKISRVNSDQTEWLWTAIGKWRILEGNRKKKNKEKEEEKQYCLFKFCILCTTSWHPAKRSAFSSKPSR